MEADKGTVSPPLGRNDPAPPGDAAIADQGQAKPAADAAPPPPRRRPALLESAIPLLAALVGLIALAGAVLVERRADENTRQIAAQMASLQASVSQLRKDADAIARAQDNGTVDALLALQDRIARLEAAARQASLAPPPAIEPGAPADAAASPPPAGTGAPVSAAAGVPASAQGTSGDCIPVGLRFMATPNSSYPICQSGIVLKVGAIGPDTVDFTGTGTVSASSFGTIPGSQCTVAVMSADAAGFAELRVSCG